jgi:hypothetical protein
MSRSLSSASSLETLRKEAKRWLKALRAGDAAAFTRLRAVTPDAPAEPGLRDVQLALAREYGLPGWTALRDALEAQAAERQTMAERAEIVARSANWAADTTGARRILERWPQVATHDLTTAVATGRIDEVRRRLAADPAAASRRTGPLDREPLLYLAYSRVPGVEAHAVAIATLLLDHGADPNAEFNDGWDNPFKVLTGVLGEGEGVQPRHPCARELAELVIARGADPFDTQALYNTSIVGDDVTWLDFLWTHSVSKGRDSAWLTVQPKAIGGKWNLPPIDYLLGNAVAFGHERRVQWLLDHGASAKALHSYSGQPLRDVALLRGDDAIVRLLEQHGSPSTPPDGFIAFHIAAMRLDAAAAREIARRHPEVLRRHETLHHAAGANRTDVIALLLDLGMDVDVMDDGEMRAVHSAASCGALEAVKLLVERGADIDRPTKHYGGAMGAAAFRKQRAVAEWLAPRSRDVNPITYFGLYSRLEELFSREPALINTPHARTGNTPLFTLPQDDEESVRMAEFLLARGADVTRVIFQQQTADQFLRTRGLLDAADLVESRR